MNPMRCITVTVVALALSACGGKAPTPADTVPTVAPTPIPTPDPDPVVDTTAPEVLATAPVDGDIGLPADASVRFIFSEPMDPESFANALDASDLGDVTLSWNANGTQLTITPVTPLEYAYGPFDAPLDALSYTVVLGVGATDLAGNPLEIGASVTFDTLRAAWMVVHPDDALTRSLTPSTLLFSTDDPLVVGDGVDDLSIHSVLTFDLSLVPEEAEAVIEATLATRQLPGDLSGDPWVDIAPVVLLDHVTFIGLDDENSINAAFNSTQTALSSHATPFCVEDQVVVEMDVAADVHDDLLNRGLRGDRSQFLLSMDGFSDLDQAVDRVVFSRDLMELQLTYLVP